jgi:hypothetical protein
MNIHLIIFGNTEKEIRDNAKKAIDEAIEFFNRKAYDVSVFALDEFEFEFVEESSMSELQRKNKE